MAKPRPAPPSKAKLLPLAAALLRYVVGEWNETVSVIGKRSLSTWIWFEDVCLKVGEQVFLSWKKRTVAVDGLWIYAVS